MCIRDRHQGTDIVPLQFVGFKNNQLDTDVVIQDSTSKQKTAYEISECDWSSDVCSSELNTDIAGLVEFLNTMICRELSAIKAVSYTHLAFFMDDYIGGRYSSTSAVGGAVLSLSLIHI